MVKDGWKIVLKQTIYGGGVALVMGLILGGIFVLISLISGVIVPALLMFLLEETGMRKYLPEGMSAFELPIFLAQFFVLAWTFLGMVGGALGGYSAVRKKNESGEAEVLPKNMEDSRLLAALCYLPVLIISLAVVAYVILAKKGGQLAKYHALQALFVSVFFFILGQILVYAVLNPLLSESQKIVDVLLAGLLVSVAPILIMLALGMFILLGNDIRIPVLSKFLMRFV